jgi:predicted phage terminase large subunit-like protein
MPELTLEDLLSLEIDQDMLAADLCQDKFFFFVKEFWSTLINETPVWNWHIEKICEVLEGVGKRVKQRLPAEFDWIIINVPPGSTKSTIVSIMYPMWCWAIDPTQRFICSSYAGDISLDLADKSRKIFWSEKYQKYFPHVKIDKDNEAKGHFKNKVGGERYATSTGAAVTGIHAHQIIVDDSTNPQKAASELARIEANKYGDETLSTRKVDKLVATMIAVQQRLHEEDNTGHLLTKGGRILHICLPAEVQDNVRPIEWKQFYENGLLDPIRLGPEAITKLRKDLGTYGAAAQLDQRPSPAEGGILKKAWFEVVKREVPRNATIKFKIDTAYTKKQTNDPSGLFAYFIEGGIMYIVNAEEQYLEFPELKKYLPLYAKRHGHSPRSTMKVEPKASGITVVQELKQIPGLNILQDKPPKDDKETRANGIAAICEAGKVKLIYGPWNDAFLDQLGSFPNGKHDEHVDNLTSAVREEFINKHAGYKYKRKN